MRRTLAGPAGHRVRFRRDRRLRMTSGYGWDRTTDLTIMSRALSPAELRSPKEARSLPERRGVGVTDPSEER